MTAIVLVLAGLFVLTGIVLMILAIKVGERGQDKSAAAVGNVGTTFIDEPLKTDMATQLGGVADLAHLGQGGAQPEQARAKLAPQGSDGPGVEQVGYDFRVRLGFRFLESHLFKEAAEEFSKAAAVTDDPAAKLSLHIAIGNAFRSDGLYGLATEAYLRAADYAGETTLKEHLDRLITEMNEQERAGYRTLRSGKED